MPNPYLIQSFRIQAYNQNEIINILPGDVYQEIKKRDEHPFFQMYSIAHEGMAQPKLEAEPGNTKPIRWPRQAIQSIKNLVLKGIKFFNQHNPENKNQVKQNEIGEIVYNAEKEIDNKLHHVVVTYHPKDKIEEAKKYDACSHEGFWNFIETAKEFVAESIEEISGIAGTRSNENAPAFSGAKRLASVQCFEEEGTKKNKMTDEEKIKNVIAKQDEYLRSKL